MLSSCNAEMAKNSLANFSSEIRTLYESGWHEPRDAPTLMGVLLLRNHGKSDVVTAINGKAQNVSCVFCRKMVASWPGSVKARKSSRQNRRNQWPNSGEIQKALEHSKICAVDWLVRELSKWSTGIDTTKDFQIREWRRRLEKIENDPNLDTIWYSRPTLLLKVFKTLPQPPDSEMALNLEVGLIGVSRLWAT